jgi:hypothetical protein
MMNKGLENIKWLAIFRKNIEIKNKLNRWIKLMS